MPALKTRLDRLGNQLSNGDQLMVVFNVIVDPDNWCARPVGYRINDTTAVYQLDGESDQAFDDRAEAAIRAQAPRDARVLVLEPISEQDLCEALEND